MSVLLSLLCAAVECTVCMEKVRWRRRLRCGHSYCQECLHQIADRYPGNGVTCPMCRHLTRAKVTELDVVREWGHGAVVACVWIAACAAVALVQLASTSVGLGERHLVAERLYEADVNYELRGLIFDDHKHDVMTSYVAPGSGGVGFFNVTYVTGDAETARVRRIKLSEGTEGGTLSWDAARKLFFVPLRDRLMLVNSDGKRTYVPVPGNLQSATYLPLRDLYVVTDVTSRQVILINPEAHEEVIRFGGNEGGSGQSHIPWYVTSYEGNGQPLIVVSDVMRNAILIYDVTGSLQREHPPHDALFRLSSPAEVIPGAFGIEKDMIVCDSGNGRVLYYDSTADRWSVVLSAGDLHGYIPRHAAFHTDTDTLALAAVAPNGAQPNSPPSSKVFWFRLSPLGGATGHLTFLEHITWFLYWTMLALRSVLYWSVVYVWCLCYWVFYMPISILLTLHSLVRWLLHPLCNVIYFMVMLDFIVSAITYSCIFLGGILRNFANKE